MMLTEIQSKLLALVAFNSEGEINFTSEEFIQAVQSEEQLKDDYDNISDLFADLGLFDKAKPLSELPGGSFNLGGTKKISFRTCGENGVIGEVIEEDESSENHISHHIDELTGIPTRRYFKHALHKLFAKIDHNKQQLVVLATDLDNFKSVNDTLGHAAGDALLKKVVSRVQNVVRESDVFVRVGGDEFTLLMVQNKNSSDVEMLATRLIEKVSRPFLIFGNQVNISVSVGLVSADNEHSDPDELLKQADIALYESKASGKNRLTWFEQRMADEIASRHKLEIELRRALVLGQLKLQFEPQIYQMSGEVHSLYSSIVWNHPEHGALNEKAFMVIADNIGLTPEISRWQFDTSFAETRQLGTGIEISLPVKSSFLSEEGFVDFISDLADKHGIDLKRICLEFSESVLLDNEGIAGELMLHLSKLGVRLSLGDFGSGLVALSYLRVLPFSEIKIDFSSVMNTNDESCSSSMASKIAELGNSLGIRVLASLDDSQVIHKVLSDGQFSHVEKLKVAAPIDSDKIEVFLKHIESRRGEIR